jgi:eukaryotic-like serine/threonine-protein kinase
MGSLFKDLKKRKVFTIAAVYAVVAWLSIQIIDVINDPLSLPEWFQTVTIVLFAIGFPIALILAWAYEVTPDGIKSDSVAQASQTVVQGADPKLMYVLIALVLVVAGFQISDRFLTTTEQPLRSTSTTEQSNAITRISVNIPDDQFFHPARGDFDISDDGTLFVYRGVDEGGGSLLWVRRWDELSGRPLRNTERATRPNISPDGEEVVFNSGGSVQVVTISNGLSRTLMTGGTDTPNWGPDGDWIYFHDTESGISRVPSMGGEIETISKINADDGETDHQNAQVLSESRILYTANRTDGTSLIKVANLDSGEIRDLAVGKFPLYSNTGHLLFQPLDESELLAAPFDLDALELTGAPIPLAMGLLRVGAGSAANIGLSKTGRLVYRLGDGAGREGTPVWVNREGVVNEVDPDWIVPSNFYSSGLALSPGGDRLAITIGNRLIGYDLWVKSLDSGPLSRITFTGQGNYHPTWSPDGQTLLFLAGNVGAAINILEKKADGTGIVETLLERSESIITEAFYSPDGRWLIYQERPVGNPNGVGELYALDIDSGGEAIPLQVSESFIFSAALSPDGRWLAYVSSESGRNEIYVRPFPDSDSGRWQLSSDGGSEPVWAHSGNELFYRNGVDELVAVELREGDTFAWDGQEILFSMANYRSKVESAAYAVGPDDQRFVMVKQGPLANTELILVDNWVQELK